jgi:hypothetical protein
MHELTNNKGYNSKRNNTDCTYEWALVHGTPIFTLHYLSTRNDHTHSRKYIYQKLRNSRQYPLSSMYDMSHMLVVFAQPSIHIYTKYLAKNSSVQSANPLDSRKIVKTN